MPSRAANPGRKDFTMYEVAYQMFNAKGQLVTKRKAFKTEAARAKFIKKISYDGNFYGIYGTRDPE